MGPAQRPWHISKTNFARLETFQWNLKFQCTVCGCGSVCKHVCVCLRVGCLCVFPGAGGAVPPQGSRPLSGNTSRNLSAPRGGGEASLVTHKLPLASSPSDQGHSLGTCDPRIAQRPHIRAQETAGHVGVTGFHSNMSSGLQGNVR